MSITTTNASTESQYALVANTASVFSLAAHLQAHTWMRVIACVTWIAFGLLLVFYGWSSYFWIAKTKPRTKVRTSKSPIYTSPLAGGIGGFIVGFLFASYLMLVVTSAICVSRTKAVSPTVLSIVCLISGIIGAAVGGHWPLLARLFSGLLAGACSTVVLTAVFGIHTLIVRVIVISVLSSVVTAPLLLPRRTFVHFHVLNACTSVIGMVVFLNGVALYAPPLSSSRAWVDLWALLLSIDGTEFAETTIQSWGTSSFKGYIAGAILGSLVGFAFEFVLHKGASQDTDDQWNEYLGMYTQRLEKNNSTELQNRMGVFQPGPSRWQRVTNALGASKGPAAYQNLTPDQQIENRALTEMSRAQRKRISQARSKRVKAGPAKFEALSIRDQDLEHGDSDSDATEFDSEADNDTLISTHHHTNKVKLRSPGFAESIDAQTAQLSLSYTNDSSRQSSRRESTPSVRPPSYRTSSNKSGAETSPNASPSKATTFSSSSPPASPTVPVQATPSLLNAIARIQAAQAQALAKS